MEGRRQALVALGSNLGDRATTLRAAVDRLRNLEGVDFVIVSSVFETEPVGVTDQPRFLNQVAGLGTELSPELLLAELQKLEAAAGRVRQVIWGPRTLDLDLLAYEGETRAATALTLPHPRMFERAFVVVPLREVLDHPRFRQPAWDEMRARAARPVADESTVWRYAGAT